MPTKRQFKLGAINSADQVEFDASPVISQSDKGAYVQAWVWVSNEDADATSEG